MKKHILSLCRKRSPGLPSFSSSSQHLSVLSRPGTNALQSSAPAQYLNTVNTLNHTAPVNTTYITHIDSLSLFHGVLFCHTLIFIWFIVFFLFSVVASSACFGTTVDLFGVGDCVWTWRWVWGKQLPFPPEYLAPSAERVKKDQKRPKPAKPRKEATGKVRERTNNRLLVMFQLY